MSAESPEEGTYAKADLSFEPEEEERSGDSKRKRSEDSEEVTTEFKKNRSESPDPVEKTAAAASAASTASPAGTTQTSYTAAAAGAGVPAATAPVAYATPDSSGIVTETSEIAQEKVGQVIGSKGAIIQDLQARTACKIQVNQDFPPGVPRQVVYTGTPGQVAAAKELVKLIVDRGPTAIHMLNGPVVTEIVECAQALVGRVIGTGGCNIRDIQLRCGVKIQVHQDFPEHVPRQVEITGNQTAVQMAATCVRQIIDGTSQGVGFPAMPGPMGGMPLSGGGGPVAMVNGVHVVECAKQYVGRLIGRSGETINILQAKSGARVQIDQKVPEGAPCKVNISGAPDSVNLAIQLVQEVISQGPNRLASYPNYQPAYGGGYGGAPMGGYGAPQGGGYYSMPQMGGYGGGYGAPQQAGGYYGAPAGGAAGGYGGGYSAAAGGYGPSSGYQQPSHTGYQQGAPQGGYQQAPPAAKPASSPWSEHKTDDGVSYWYNATTGLSQVSACVAVVL